MIVVFDMDECIASLSEPCEIYHSYLNQGIVIPVEFDAEFGQDLLLKYLRPGIEEILQVLYDCKTNPNKEPRIFPVHKLVLMTNASNESGWVEYVVTHLEAILKTHDDLFDAILARESPFRTRSSKRLYGGLQPKFMDDVIKVLKIRSKCPIVMYDDHDRHLVPANGYKNYLTKVPAYHLHEREHHDRYRTFATFLPPLFRAMNN
jgi:hypothetical protein